MKMLAAIVFAAAALCGYAQETPAEVSVPVEMKVGETVSVILDGNPTTGYAWELVEPIPSVTPVFVSVNLLDEKECEGDAAESENPCCGAPRPTVVKMTGVHAGHLRFSVQYRRAWEQGVPPMRVQTFVVTVHPRR